ncbi:MAG TPA: alpha/beta hydrolase [Acidimicrobiales bacterium]|nr:alpha/beta hydrolase [Acidimicrobiales bacterium]
MSWLLLLFGAWCALLALNAWRPVRRNRLLFVWSFFAAWMTIEAAPLWVVVELAVGVVLVWLGALDHVAGWIGLALLVVAWLDLIYLIVQGRAAAATATDAFGDFGRRELDGWSPPPSGKVVVDRNVEFRRVAGKRLRLDVHRPATSGRGRPAIMQIHGGAWMIGDKREQGLPLLRHLASHGWVGFNVNYRLSPSATFPDHLVDLKAALVWIRQHADDYGIDPDFVVVTGGSAGGHLAALMALTANDARYQPGFEHADTSVQAAVPFYGVYDFTNRNSTMPPEFLRWMAEPYIIKAFLDEEPERFAEASPLDQVRADAPPFLVVHGDKDTLAPVEDARAFVASLSAVSTSPVIYVELRGAQHAFDLFGSPRTRRMVRAVERFLYVVRQGQAAPTTSPPLPPEPPPSTVEAAGSAEAAAATTS